MKDNTDRTLILIGLVCLFLLLLHFLPPLSVGSLPLRHVSILSDLSPHPTHHDTTSLLPQPAVPQDTTHHGKKTPHEQWPKGVEPILDYSAGAPGGMAHFYQMLDSLQHHRLTARPLRIAYFSDSYTEGDILCADLRSLLQQAYGGQGVGWIDAANEVNQFRLSLAASDKFLEGHMAVGDDTYRAQYAGLAARYALLRGNASLRYKGLSFYPRAGQWPIVRLFLKPRTAITVTATTDGETARRTLTGGAIQETVFTTTPIHDCSSTTLSLHGSGTVYGASLEGRQGIVLDNFSMRSSTGEHLGQVPDETLRAFQRLRSYDLVIIAFGGNAVLPTSLPEECQPYVRKMSRVVAKLKQCYAGASILLFSMPDFGSKRDDGEIITSDAIKALVSHQNQMAADHKIGFYNLLSAEGGYGAAGRLNQQKLVGNDLFHINQKGGAYVAERIFRSLQAGLKNYQRNRK